MIRKKIVVFLVLILLLGAGLRILSLGNDFTADEVDFIKPAEALKSTGSPVFYHSEQQKNEIGLWHPPFYLLLVSLILDPDFPEISARLINFSFSLITALVIFLFCYNFFEGRKGKIVGLLSSAIFLINYYVLSSSILIDIDMSSALFTFSFLFFILMFYKTERKSFLVLAAVSLVFSLANRYPIAFISFFSLGMYIYRTHRKKFNTYLLLGFFSGIIFLLLWTFYSTVIEPGNFFSFIDHNARLGASQVSDPVKYILSFFLNITQLIRLLTLPFVLLVIFSIVKFVREKRKITTALLVYSLPVFVFFILIPRPAYGYPRYFLSSIPPLVILSSLFIYESFENSRINKNHIYLFLTAFILSTLFLVLLSPQLTLYREDGLIKATNLPDFIFNILASSPVFLSFFAEKRKRYFVFLIILLSLLLSYSIYFGIKLTANENDIKEAGNYVRSRTAPGDLILAPKSVAYYSERKFYVNDRYDPEVNLDFVFLADYFRNSIIDRDMKGEIFWREDFYLDVHEPKPKREALKSAEFIVSYHKLNGLQLEKVIGDIYIHTL